MTGQSDSGRDQSLDPALADEVESAFEEVRDELGEDPQADLDTGAAGSEGGAAPGEPGGPAASGAPGPDGPARDEGARDPAQEPAEDGSASELEQARAEAARLTD